MNNDVIVNLLIAIVPALQANPGLAQTIAYVLTFAISLLIGMGSVSIYVRKYFPQIAAFLMFVYEQTAKVDKLSQTDKNNISVPLDGIEKKDKALLAVNKALYDPNNDAVTKKAMKAYKNVTGKKGDVSTVIDAVVPVMKAVKRK